MATREHRENIVLTGFMGVGKTTVGRADCRCSPNRRFVDADDVIVERAEMSIPEIFAAKGEAAFRALESEVCRDLAARTRLGDRHRRRDAGQSRQTAR